MIGPKPSARPGARPRMSGGFNPGMGMGNEHLDESAMQAAVKQKSLGQQATSSAQSTTGGSALGSQSGAPSGAQSKAGTPQKPVKPRGVASLTDELIKLPAKDVVSGLRSLFDINSLLGIKVEDDPATQAKKRQMLSRWNKLNDEQKQVADKNYGEETQKEKQEQEEEQAKKQQLEEQRAKGIQPPSSPQKGPIGPAAGKGKKQQAAQLLQQQRKTMGNKGAKH